MPLVCPGQFWPVVGRYVGSRYKAQPFVFVNVAAADMGPKKPASAEAGKVTKEKITLEMKEITRKHDGGI